MLGTITLTPYKGLVMVFTDGDDHLLRLLCGGLLAPQHLRRDPRTFD
jgi:hypothetical protein